MANFLDLQFFVTHIYLFCLLFVSRDIGLGVDVDSFHNEHYLIWCIYRCIKPIEFHGMRASFNQQSSLASDNPQKCPFIAM